MVVQNSGAELGFVLPWGWKNTGGFSTLSMMDSVQEEVDGHLTVELVGDET